MVEKISTTKALSEAIEFAEQDGQVLTPIGEAIVERWRVALAGSPAEHASNEPGNSGKAFPNVPNNVPENENIRSAPPSGKLVEDMARAMTFEEASVLARKAIYDDGRGMIGVNRNYLQDRVARAILSVANKRTLSDLPGNGGQL